MKTTTPWTPNPILIEWFLIGLPDIDRKTIVVGEEIKSCRDVANEMKQGTEFGRGMYLALQQEVTENPTTNRLFIAYEAEW
ncbi:MAG: hypothetical protein Q8L34_04745 [Candidatus Woesearchaeota archaeon]|nr:hypothetical protein [Candidatus Woesearchaeota archaeon]